MITCSVLKGKRFHSNRVVITGGFRLGHCLVEWYSLVRHLWQQRTLFDYHFMFDDGVGEGGKTISWLSALVWQIRISLNDTTYQIEQDGMG